MSQIEIKTIKILDTNYSYLLCSKSTAVVIDPGEAEPILKELNENKLNLSHILLTHSHHDHTGGVTKLLDHFPKAEVIVHKTDILSIFNNTLSLEIIKTPGHTSDSCCFYFPTIKSVFTGDTLFIGICGRVIDGTYKDMYNSLKSLRLIPEETKVFPGHEYINYAIKFMEHIKNDASYYKKIRSSLQHTIGSEILHNPFMTDDYDEFKRLRILKN